MASSLQTLFLPLEVGDVPMGPSALFLGAAWHPALASFSAPPDLWQPDFALAQELEQRGLKVSPTPSHAKAYALVLVHLPKQVEEAKYWLALALEQLEIGGTLLAAAANDAGGSRLEGWFKEAGLTPQSFSKNKARAVWAMRPETLPSILQSWKENGQIRRVPMGDDLVFQSQPGLFGWNKIDTGSKILADHLPDGLSGAGADFGCGTGYLSHRLLQKTTPKDWHMIDIDRRAVACATENIKDVQGDCPVMAHWADLSKPVAGLPPLNFILMNPPFHTGKKTDAGLGQNFIRTSAHHLRKGGWLIMVANVHLPYEATLKDLFFEVDVLAVKDGFKILKATK